MKNLILEIPTIFRKKDAIDFINDFKDCKSDIKGSADLEEYINNYENWILKLVDDCNETDERVPALTYFAVRENDNKIIGIVNIRLKLNNKLENYGGHISYSIRPSEKGKDYSKTILNLAIKECEFHNIDKILLTCYRKNIATTEAILSLNGVKFKEIFDEIANDYLEYYNIDINKN